MIQKIKKISYRCTHCQLQFLLDYKSGFGGKFGVQNDRVDKCAVGWEHKEELTKHESQKGKYTPSTILGSHKSFNAMRSQSMLLY